MSGTQRVTKEQFLQTRAVFAAHRAARRAKLAAPATAVEPNASVTPSVPVLTAAIAPIVSSVPAPVTRVSWIQTLKTKISSVWGRVKAVMVAFRNDD